MSGDAMANRVVAGLMLSVGMLGGLLAASPSAAAATGAITVSDITLVPGALQTQQRVTLNPGAGASDEFDVSMPQVIGNYVQAVLLESTVGSPCDVTQSWQRWHCRSFPGADHIRVVWQTPSIPKSEYPVLTGQRFAVTVTNTTTGVQGTGYVSVRPETDLVLESIVPGRDSSMIQVSVFDHGPSPSSAATVTITVAGSYDPASLPGNCARSGARITCTVDHRPNTQVLIQIPLAADTGQISISATVTGPAFDPVTANNQLSVGPWNLFGSGSDDPGPPPGSAGTGNAPLRRSAGTGASPVPDPRGSTGGAAPASSAPSPSDAPTPEPASPRVLAVRTAHSGPGKPWTIRLAIALAAALTVASLLLWRRYRRPRQTA